MKTIGKIVNVNEFSHFEIKGDEICFIDNKNKLNVIDLYTFNLKYIIPLDRCFLFETDDIYIYVYMKDKGIYKVKNGIINPYWQSEYQSNFLFNKNYIIGTNYDIDTNISSVAFYNRKTKQLMWKRSEENISTIRIFDTIFFVDQFKNPTYVEKINVTTGKMMWKLNFEHKVEGNILKHKDVFFIPLEHNHLLGINAQTGEKLWELEDCFHYYNLDEQTGLLYGYGAERYEIIDAVKGEKILQKQLGGSMDKYKIFVSQHMSTLYRDGLYFTSNDSVIKFGKINIRTQEIEFVQELGVKEGVKANKPVYHKGRLYILDMDGTLHIFEEELNKET